MAQPGDEDISPYATFHLLGMREENKNGMMNPQAYKTMPHPPGQMQQPQQQQQKLRKMTKQQIDSNNE